MIFDFISGEASTQEGGEKFAKWLAEDADLTQKEKKSVIEKIKDFFAKLLDSTPEHTVCDEYAQEVLDTLRGMVIMLSDEQKGRWFPPWLVRQWPAFSVFCIKKYCNKYRNAKRFLFLLLFV